MNFRVGQQVVCICGEWDYIVRGEIVPKKGGIYTIREIVLGVNDRYKYLRFYEIINLANNYSDGFDEAAFDAIAFRPLIKRKTSIEIFERLLDPANHKHLENV